MRGRYRGRMARRALVPLLGVLAVLASGLRRRRAGDDHDDHHGRGGPAKTGTVWLCFPGQDARPVLVEPGDDRRSSANGSRTVETPKAPASPPIDCFYVYPTVSSENQGNSDLQIQLPQIFVAQAQASRFSQVCRSTRRCTARSPTAG